MICDALPRAELNVGREVAYFPVTASRRRLDIKKKERECRRFPLENPFDELGTEIRDRSIPDGLKRILILFLF